MTLYFKPLSNSLIQTQTFMVLFLIHVINFKKYTLTNLSQLFNTSRVMLSQELAKSPGMRGVLRLQVADPIRRPSVDAQPPQEEKSFFQRLFS